MIPYLTFLWGLWLGTFCCGLYWHSSNTIAGCVAWGIFLAIFTVAYLTERNKP